MKTSFDPSKIKMRFFLERDSTLPFIAYDLLLTPDIDSSLQIFATSFLVHWNKDRLQLKTEALEYQPSQHQYFSYLLDSDIEPHSKDSFCRGFIYYATNIPHAFNRMRDGKNISFTIELNRLKNLIEFCIKKNEPHRKIYLKRKYHQKRFTEEQALQKIKSPC